MSERILVVEDDPRDVDLPSQLPPIQRDRVWTSLFKNLTLRGRYYGRRGWGNGERQPRIPSRRTVGYTEFAVPPQAQGALHVSDREAVSDLRTDTENA